MFVARAVAAILVVAALLTGCTDGGADEQAGPGATAEVVPDAAAEPTPSARPDRTQLERVQLDLAGTDARSSSDVGDVRTPPPSTSIVVAAGESASSTSEVDVGEVVRSFAGEVTDEGTVLTVAEPILFAFDSAELRPGAEAALRDISGVLTAYPDAPVRVVGHTDGRGTDAYNDDLSQRRADAVVDVIEGFDIEASRLTAQGAGSTDPVAEEVGPDGEDLPEGRAANRRVEIVIVGVEADG